MIVNRIGLVDCFCRQIRFRENLSCTPKNHPPRATRSKT
jgi:hypothetical protein